MRRARAPVVHALAAVGALGAASASATAADAQTPSPVPAAPSPAASSPLSDTAPVPSAAPNDVAAAPSAFFPEAPAEAPPPLPRKKGLVLDTRIGALAYLGKFGTLAPPGPWLETQLGWEFFSWLMVYGYAELTFTGTSGQATELQSTYFPIWGFGGGVRFTVHATDRVAFFLQANAGAMSAIVPRDTLTFLGYQPAESLGFAPGARLGVEWYQIDRHMALGLSVGVRDAFNFKVQDGESDVPLMLDASVAFRYTF